MTFEQVLVFHRIVEFGSFKAAANKMHKTQPAISFSIKKLEDELGVELFDRSNYRPELTQHGRVFLERSQKALQGMEELEVLARGLRNHEEPEIAIAIDGISPLPKLLTLFKTFNEKYPQTKFNLGFEVLSDAERKVLSKEALFGITHFITDSTDLDVQHIANVKMLPVICKKLTSSRGVKSQADLLNIEQIVVGDKAGPKGFSFGLLEGGLQWRINDANFKRDIILAGLGWGHLPEHIIEREVKEKKLVVLNYETIKPRELTVNLIRLKKQPMGVVSKAIWDEMKILGNI